MKSFLSILVIKLSPSSTSNCGIALHNIASFLSENSNRIVVQTSLLPIILSFIKAMFKCIIITLLWLCMGELTNAFHMKPLKLNILQRSSTCSSARITPLMMASSSSQNVATSPMDSILKPKMDFQSISVLLVAQSILIMAARAFETMVPFGTGKTASFIFNKDSLSTALTKSLPLLLGTAILSRLNWSYVKRIKRTAKVFALRLLGRKTSKAGAFITASFLSFTSGNYPKSVTS